MYPNGRGWDLRRPHKLSRWLQLTLAGLCLGLALEIGAEQGPSIGGRIRATLGPPEEVLEPPAPAPELAPTPQPRDPISVVLEFEPPPFPDLPSKPILVSPEATKAMPIEPPLFHDTSVSRTPPLRIPRERRTPETLEKPSFGGAIGVEPAAEISEAGAPDVRIDPRKNLPALTMTEELSPPLSKEDQGVILPPIRGGYVEELVPVAKITSQVQTWKQGSGGPDWPRRLATQPWQWYQSRTPAYWSNSRRLGE